MEKKCGFCHKVNLIYTICNYCQKNICRDCFIHDADCEECDVCGKCVCKKCFKIDNYFKDFKFKPYGNFCLKCYDDDNNFKLLS